MTSLRLQNHIDQQNLSIFPSSESLHTLDHHAATVLLEDTYRKFLPFFQNQVEGSIRPNVAIKFSTRMRQKLGLAYLFAGKIHLNWRYFREQLHLMPYTLFHEMTHMWLYDSYLDPGHTVRFYRKMNDFYETGLPTDPEVLVHSRVAPEGRYVYSCPHCRNRWFRRDALEHSIYCGHCYDSAGVQYIAELTVRETSEIACHQVCHLGGAA